MRMYSAPPTAATSPPTAMTPITRSTAGLNWRSNGAFENVMSQCRRGTANPPANDMKTEKINIPPANRYGCHFASGQNAIFFRKISGIR